MGVKVGEIHFYTLKSNQQLTCDRKLPDGYSVEVWRARADGLNLKGLPYRKFAIWWLLDRIGLFSSPHVGGVLVRNGQRIVHHSLVTPKWYRFPNMGSTDLQIGNVWTSEDQRGRGLAKIAINEVHRQWASQCSEFWYLVGADNLASIGLIESCGYKLTAIGKRTKPYKILAFGRFRVESWISNHPSSSNK